MDDNIVTKVERHLARVAGKGKYKKPLKMFTKSKERYIKSYGFNIPLFGLFNPMDLINQKRPDDFIFRKLNFKC